MVLAHEGFRDDFRCRLSVLHSHRLGICVELSLGFCVQVYAEIVLGQGISGGLVLLGDLAVLSDDGVAKLPREATASLSARKVADHALRAVQLVSQLRLRQSGLQQVFNHLLPVHFFSLKSSLQVASYRLCDIHAIAKAIFICITIAI